tara:strand:+ start:6032 stop:6526 length:495 start_codon:yes stop_codon:yes gene_type:complete
MKPIELFIERVILGARWILVIFYAGLAAALALYAVSYVQKLAKLFSTALTMDEAQMILAMLGLIDAALVASLVLMVMVSSYENFVSRFDESKVELSWLGKMDAGSLKVKVASAIVAISSIHLLQVFLNINEYEAVKVMWLTIMHMAFVGSAVALGMLDWISVKK